MSSVIRGFRSTGSAAVVVLVMLTSLRCGGDGPQRRQVMDDTSAARLTGTWDITLRLERPMTFSTNPKTLPRNVRGTVAFLEDHDAPASLADLNGPTHTGVYDIDLDSLEMPVWSAGGVHGLVAKIGALLARPDSLFLVLNPESPGHFVRLSGVLVDGSGSGTWVAESPLGGGGTFTLRRRAEPLSR
jgi:hypothetical protein